MTSANAPAPPDELERFFLRLVFNLAELDRTRLDGPIQLAEIHQSLVPYRTHRASLGVETNQDYEMVVLRFLSGERGYARVEPDEVDERLDALHQPLGGAGHRRGAAAPGHRLWNSQPPAQPWVTG